MRKTLSGIIVASLVTSVANNTLAQTTTLLSHDKLQKIKGRIIEGVVNEEVSQRRTGNPDIYGFKLTDFEGTQWRFYNASRDFKSFLLDLAITPGDTLEIYFPDDKLPEDRHFPDNYLIKSENIASINSQPYNKKRFLLLHSKNSF